MTRLSKTRRASALLSGAAICVLIGLAPANAQTSATTPASTPATTQEAVVAMMGAPADMTLNQAIEKRLMRKKTEKRLNGEFTPATVEAVKRAYAQRNYAPLWTPASARAFREASRDLKNHGLIVDDVFSNDLDALVRDRAGTSDKARARADLRLTLAALRALRATSNGLADEGEIVTDGTAPQSALVDTLQKLAAGDMDQLNSFAPTHPHYGALQTALVDYKALRRAGGWKALPDGDAIELDDTDARVSALRTRLRAEGYDVPDSDTPDLYDADVEAALKTFQRRHGLEDDGIVGGNTLEALNESVDSKIARIAESLHRWRQHGDLGERYVIANIPSYTAEGWNGNVREIKMRTQVGKPQHATPTFTDDIEYIVANPKWYVPTSIARRQKLSKLRRDASYAPRNDYAVVSRDTGEAVSAASVDWNAPDVLSRYRLIQGPGPKNALGQVKIIFPNQYAVYLHDTPSDHLFDQAQRAFSSGCVRLERPFDMARWVADGDSKLSADGFTEQLESGERERMYLGETVPVHITYHTVTVDAEGPLFHRDVYDRLDEIEAAQKLASLD